MAQNEQVADIICRDVAELPDRTSPKDFPDAMLVTNDELHLIVTRALEAGKKPIENALAAPSPDQVGGESGAADDASCLPPTCPVCRHETGDERRERIRQIMKDVADLPGAIERCQQWCDSQDLPYRYGDAGPPINFADVRALINALTTPTRIEASPQEAKGDWIGWRGGVEGYERCVEVALKGLSEIGPIELADPETTVRHLFWLIGLDHLWQHVYALRDATPLCATPPQAAESGLLEAAQRVYDSFKRDMDQGYRTADKVFAVDVLGEALAKSGKPQPDQRSNLNDTP